MNPTRLAFFVILLTSWLFVPRTIFAAPSFSGLPTSLPSVAKYEKFEVSFNVNSTAQNPYFPYAPAPPAGGPTPPPGIDPTNPSYQGVTIDAIFTDPNGAEFKQPTFYYQTFDDQIKGGNDEWFYPKNEFSWKVRFSPNQVGTWQFRLSATDSTGTINTTNQPFQVTDSTNHGFIKASPNDPRYFEYDDGTYFPALGFNLNGGSLDNRDPVLGNIEEFSTMSANGIELTRIWPSQFSIYGEAWAGWNSNNRYHTSVQEQRYGIINPNSELLSTNYPGLVAPTPLAGSEYYLWLEYNTTPASNGELQRFTPCRYVDNIPVKQNTQYRIKVRYQIRDLEGPKVAGQPFGFAVKTTSEYWGTLPDRCNDPDAGSLVAQTTSTTNSTDWTILEGTFNNGVTDFLPYLYLTFNNVKSQDSDNDAGHVFIDQVWLEEASCSANCPNLINKPNMDMHHYINQRAAYAFDKVVGLAQEYGIYLKAVMNEKNDRIFNTIDFNGNLSSSQSGSNFYGNFRTVTKVRWLQQSWWRYIQARWGYSPNIHSWELLNEGNDGRTSGHWDLADEFGKYMKCRVFDVVVSSVDPYEKCQYDHPNAHLVSTSFFASSFPWQFWNNQASGVELTFAEMDYADQHYYANVDDTSPIAGYYDSAQFSYALSTWPNFAPGKRKPFIRGETAWSAPASTYLQSNADGGEWLHDFIWAGINQGGLIEHFFGGGTFTYQIWKANSHDNRSMFGTFYRFIKDIPLNNGQYQDANASSSINQIRAWGQKDLVNKRAHLWIANKNHTWYNTMGGYTGGPAPTPVGSVTGTITLAGFTPSTSYPIEWWNTYTGAPDPNQGNPGNTITANSNGELVLQVSNLVSDAAVRIGNYSTSTTPPPTPTPNPDLDGDGNLDFLDLSLIFRNFFTLACSFNFLGDCRINIFDYNYIVSQFPVPISNPTNTPTISPSIAPSNTPRPK